MYNVFIVDDEKWIRTGIERIIEWDKIDLNVCGSVSSAEEAMIVLENNYPDILVTDILMGSKSGLELTEWIKSNHADTQVIIISGFDNFKYAQNAIELGVAEYILKPIEEKILTNALMKCINNLKQKENLNMLQTSHLADVGISKENFFLRVFTNLEFEFEAKGLEEEAKKLDLDTESSYLVVQFVAQQIEESTRLSSIRLEIERFLDENLRPSEEYNVIVQNHQESTIVFTIQTGDTQKFKSYITNIINGMNQRDEGLSYQTICYIGNTYIGIKGINKSYREIQRLRNEMIVSKNIWLRDVELLNQDKETTEHINQTIKSEIVTMLKEKNWPGIERLLGTFFDKLERSSILKRSELVNFIYDLVYECNKTIESSKIRLNIPIVEDADLVGWIVKVDDIEIARNKLINYFDYLENNLKVNSSSCQKRLVNDIVLYCDNNFCQNITLQELAGVFYLNASYLSQLFSKEVGTPLSKYLMNLRMEKAKKMLITTNLRVYSIAVDVGYTDVKYFLKVFKKSVGFTPQAYRERNG